MEQYRVAVVGSGPAGLSAACRAAELGLSHILLEGAPHFAHTIQRYQRGKFVMAEPSVLPLRAPVPFEPGPREEILSAWEHAAAEYRTESRCSANVTAIEGERGDFTLTLADGARVGAETVVLAIGVQGNPRKLGRPGDDLPFVQYQLDDPWAYSDETIVVVGAGDAAIENALGLVEQNRVIIVNKRDEFTRAKDANNQAILQAIDDDRTAMECFYDSGVDRIDAFDDDSDYAGQVTLDTPQGKAEIPVHRVIARLGSIPPRDFVESCGVTFPNDDPGAVPEVDSYYESNVDGLYIIGSLAGYPLIKQALNQGYEVIEYIQGNDVEPADTPLLREKFAAIPGGDDVPATLAWIQERIPMLAPITQLQLREFLLDSEIHAPKRGEVIFRYKDYTNSIYSILQGSVEVQPGDPNDPKTPRASIPLEQGQFFGEMSLISGRRRSATVIAGDDCIVIESSRRSLLNLMHSVEAVRRVVEESFLLRAIQSQIAPGCSTDDLAELVRSATVEQYAAGDVLFREGEPGDCLQLIRRGSVTVSREIGGRDIVLAYVPAGQYVGEMALVSDAPRSATVRAAIATETIRLDGDAFKRLMEQHPDVRQRVQQVYKERLTDDMDMANQTQAGNIISFLVEQGLGEATDVLLIDESLCIRCDYCESACADTHGGVSRLNREAGPTFANVHVPTSCRHCEHPHCMKECPPDAIHRHPSGEVYIDDTCIGCGKCEENCPYGVIRMGTETRREPSLWTWLLTGLGPEPGEELAPKKKEDQSKKAVKCDMCKDLAGGPACVRACPTGAAIRMSPESFFELVSNDD